MDAENWAESASSAWRGASAADEDEDEEDAPFPRVLWKWWNEESEPGPPGAAEAGAELETPWKSADVALRSLPSSGRNEWEASLSKPAPALDMLWS